MILLSYINVLAHIDGKDPDTSKYSCQTTQILKDEYGNKIKMIGSIEDLVDFDTRYKMSFDYYPK